jgi:uncharacterized membrane-anchored protein YhcB (DUF1043 family)
MFGDISIWAWMGAAIMFAIGGATGYFISRQLKDKRTRELEEKLAATRTELADYRGEVNQHFLKTSLLVGKLTNNYREVYEHLATGAQKLCNEKPGTPKLDLPDTNILPTTESADSERPAIEQASENAIEASPGAGLETQATTDKAVEEPPVESPVETHDENSDESAELAPSEIMSAPEDEKPSPEDIPSRDEGDEEVPLGAESSTPSVETELHKTHPSVH